MALLPRFRPLLCAVPPCLPTSLAGNQHARSCSSPGAQWLVLCPQAKGVLEDRAPRTSEPSRSSISWQRLLWAMKAQQPRVLIHLCKAEQIPTWLCTAAPLPTWAWHSKGSEFTPSSWQHCWNILLIILWFLRVKSEMKRSPRAYLDFVIKATVRGRNKRGEQLMGMQRSDRELQSV